jgi:hypothetical protein
MHTDLKKNYEIKIIWAAFPSSAFLLRYASQRAPFRIGLQYVQLKIIVLSLFLSCISTISSAQNRSL